MSELAPQPPTTPEAIRAHVQQAMGKGQLALLVTDAAGNVIAGIKATGGLTQLQYLPADGTWEFHGAFSGPEVIEGSYTLRNNMGMDPEPQEPDAPPYWPGRELYGRTQPPRAPYERPRLDGPHPLPPPADPGRQLRAFQEDGIISHPELPRRQPGRALDDAKAADRWGPT